MIGFFNWRLLPFIADSPEWQRESMNNLILIIAISIPGNAKGIFSHCKNDDKDTLNRLRIFIHPTGNQEIQERGIALMTIVMLNDYYSDQKFDEKIGKYNPLISGVWNYEQKKQELALTVQRKACPLMDHFFSLEDALTRSFWLND